MNLIGKKYLFFVISAILIIPGIVSLFLYGLNLSIEFTGGSRLTFAFSKNATNDQIIKIRNVFEESKIKVSTIEKSEKKRV